MQKLPSFEARTSSAGSKADTEIVAVFQDSGKKAVSPMGAAGNLVEKLRKARAFAANAGTQHFVRFGGKAPAENTLLVGMGPGADLTEEKARVAGGNAWARLRAEKCTGAGVLVDSFFEARGTKADVTPFRLVRAFAEGLILASYSFEKYKTGKAKASDDDYLGVNSVVFQTQDKSLKQQLDHELPKIHAVGAAVTVTRDWSNEPSNYGTPSYYANEARKLARQYGLKCKVLSERDCEREKMGLFLGVGRGAERESKIVVVEYTPKGAKNVKNLKTIALVGKGVTFDSGGISIKPSLRMEEMKHDMTGAATVFGATLLAAKWGAPNRIVTIMAFTENMPGGDAIQPGNVLTSRSGKTVEVINTDAEGRLVLADALDYIQDLKPDAVVDAATLTGAVSIALGKHACGILGNEETLIDALKRAGSANGERIWQLPLYDEYFDDLKSDCADMKNSANDGLGGTIRGAIFLKQFIRKGVAWAHLDIAATAWGLTHLSYYPKKGASGAYVRTLAQFALDF